jgi:hypothetical protein
VTIAISPFFSTRSTGSGTPPSVIVREEARIRARVRIGDFPGTCVPA